MIFDVLPEDFHRNPTVVVGCFFLFEGTMLLLHRQPHKPQGGTWCLPGGKLVGAEDAVTATRREVREETGVEPEENRLEYQGRFYVRYPPREDFVYIVRACRFRSRPAIVLAPDEHQAFRWATVPEALAMNLIQDQDEVIRRLAHRLFGPT